MNTFAAARRANEARRSHVCNDRCPKDSDDRCTTQIKLWKAQHEAALRWNATASESPVTLATDRSYL